MAGSMTVWVLTASGDDWHKVDSVYASQASAERAKADREARGAAVIDAPFYEIHEQEVLQ